jgi:hypothetical protein
VTNHTEFIDLVGECGELIPSEFRARPGQTTPNGGPALFRSNAHASMAIRLLFMAANPADYTSAELQARRDRYLRAWRAYVAHAQHMQTIVALYEQGDLDEAAREWNLIEQPSLDKAFRVVLGEREEHRAGVSLARSAWRHFGLLDTATPVVGAAGRDRPVRASDNDAAWARSPGGVCRGCGTATISHTQRTRLHRTFKKRPDLFRIDVPYSQYNKVPALLWPQITIAAKGVAEHVVARSHGGPTAPTNLTNVCAGCNYTRGNNSMDAAGIAAYDRPAEELRL